MLTKRGLDIVAIADGLKLSFEKVGSRLVVCLRAWR